MAPVPSPHLVDGKLSAAARRGKELFYSKTVGCGECHGCHTALGGTHADVRFVVPEGFEITDISSPMLARWDIQPDGNRKVATVRFREQTTDDVVLSISAVRAGVSPGQWQLPRWEPLETSSSQLFSSRPDWSK